MFYLTTRPGGATHFNPVAAPRVNNETRLSQRPEKLVPKSGGSLILIHSPKIFTLTN